MYIKLTKSDNRLLLKYIEDFNIENPKGRIALDCYINHIESNDDDENDIKIFCKGIEPNIPSRKVLDVGKDYTLDLCYLDSDVRNIMKLLLRELKLKSILINE